jgi:hypothetical protein
MKNKSNAILLPIILAIALALRFAGIDHGFPFIFHPDEPTVVRTALALRFFPNPGHFDWPHLYMYMNYFLYMGFAFIRNFAAAVGLKSQILSILPIIWDDGLIYYLLTRMLSAFMGALTVIPIYLAARDSFGKRVGILSALSFAVIPYHVWNSHYALIDVPMLFFASWGVFYALAILKRNSINDYAGGGFYIGLSASTKYNGGLTILTIPLAHLIRVIKNKEPLFNLASIFNLGIAVFTSMVGFLMGTPYALLDFSTFTRVDGYKGALWQFRNVGSVEWPDRIPEFFNEMIHKVADDLGYTILACFFLLIAVLVYRAIVKKQHEEDSALWFLLISGLIFLFYVSGFSRSRSQYYFIAYPYVTICFAYFLDWTMSTLGRKNRVVECMIFMALLGPPAFLSLRNAYIYSNQDTRVGTYRWLRANLNKSDLLVYSRTNLSVITDKFKNPKVKGEPGIQNMQKGYIVVAYDDSCNCSDFPIAKYGARINKVVEFDSYLNQGPKIEIYSFNK